MSETQRYCVYVIPAAFRLGANRLMALQNADVDPLTSVSFSQGANDTGSLNDPATHYFGGMPVTEEWLAEVSNWTTAFPTPPTTWEALGTTEEDVLEAAGQVFLQVTITQDGDRPSSMATLNAALTALGLMRQDE